MNDDRWYHPGNPVPLTDTEQALHDRLTATYTDMYVARRLVRGRLTEHGAAYLAMVAVDAMRKVAAE